MQTIYNIQPNLLDVFDYIYVNLPGLSPSSNFEPNGFIQVLYLNHYIETDIYFPLANGRWLRYHNNSTEEIFNIQQIFNLIIQNNPIFIAFRKTIGNPLIVLWDK